MKNKKLHTLLSTIEQQQAEATPELANLGQELAAKLRGGTATEPEGPIYCDLGCAPNVSCPS